MNIYDVTNEYTNNLNRLQEMLDAGEINEQEFFDTADGLTFDIDQKVISTMAFVANLNAYAKAIDDAADAMKKRATSKKNLAKRLKQGVCDSMLKAGIKKVESFEFTVSLSKTPDKVVLEDESLLNEHFFKTERKVMLSEVKKALKDGDLDGAYLESGHTVRVK